MNGLNGRITGGGVNDPESDILPPKPEVLPLIPDRIPELLRNVPAWLGWRWEWKADSQQWSKAPINLRKGNGSHHAKSTDRETWVPFPTAVKRYQQWGCDGIGCCVTTGWVFIDLDGVLGENGKLRAECSWATDVLKQLRGRAYVEVSPSGRGLHLITRGELPPGGRSKGFPELGEKCKYEMYVQGRYFAFTGHVHKLSAEPHLSTMRLAKLHARLFPPQSEHTNGQPPLPLVGNDEDLLKEARGAGNGGKFSRLFDAGDIRDYTSASEADLALCSLLAFWTGGNAARMDRLFRQSKLYRDKWDGESYRNRTIEKARAAQAEFYQPNGGAAVGAEAEKQKPHINISAPKQDTVVKECIRALRQRNDSEPALFTRGHEMVYVVKDKRGRASIAGVQEPFLLGEMERVADFYQTKDKKMPDGSMASIPVPGRPTVSLAKAILSRPQTEWGLPALDGVVTGPVLGKNWSIQVEPGYNPKLSLYYAPREKLELPEIPAHPTIDQCSAAVTVIDDVIGEFPWVSAADRVNYMALLLTPLLRHRLDGCVPIALLDSPKKGNGKTMLAQILGIIHEGEEPVLWTPPSGENWEKIITTVLLSGQPITVFDNLENTLSSPVLSKVVTSNMHADRQFHTQKRLVMRNSTLFIVTGNNIKLSGDVGRRCYQIRLDAGTSRPWERRKFRHPYLKTYIRKQRGAILAALLTMAQGWVAAGKLKLHTRELGGGFERWSRTVGRILAHAGVEGFLDNQERLYADSDVSEGQWVNFLETLRREYPQGFEISGFVMDLELGKFPKDTLPDEPEFGKPDALKISGLFRRKHDTRFGKEGLRLINQSKRGGASHWLIRGDSNSLQKI